MQWWENSRKTLTDVEAQDIVWIFEGTLTTLMVIIEVVIQGLPEEILQFHGSDGLQRL